MQTCPNCGEQNSDTAKFCQECAAALRSQPALPQEARKTVTVLFCDLVGSTALGERLDSESLREVMDRYFTEMKRVVERHGGIVEKYIGDAVMAVFGLPRAHEDDALRAVRAASEMGTALSSLNTELERYWDVALAHRIGVTTGGVVVGDASSGQRLATGDTVNVAARLEQAALAGTVLIGEPTQRLVRDAVEMEAVEPLALKGKSERLPAFRLIEVKRGAESVGRRLDTPLVGRHQDLGTLLSAFEQTVRDDSCRMVVVVGEAGVGKSRLVAEVVGRLKDQARILNGRCLSYGEGITFFPVADIVRDAARISEDDSLAVARHKVTRLVGGDDPTADRVAALIGLSNTSYAIEESFWAVRRMLEVLAQRQPLGVVIEDIHWAEPALLDLLSHIVSLAAAPILLVCSSRKEAFEGDTDWLKNLPNASKLVLNPLTTEDSEKLIQNVLGSAGLHVTARDRITQAAEGNPLFVEQILSMWIDDGTLTLHDGQWRLSAPLSDIDVPPTISALLSARLDRLEQDERTVIAGASVVGQVFYRGAVVELCPSELAPQVTPSLATLTTQEFIRPATAAFANEETFIFRHVLIRDAAYGAVLKRTRAVLHQCFASWLQRVAGERASEYEEIVGYHLEQAYLHFQALGRKDDRIQEVGRRAAHHLSSAGRRALGRGDMAGVANLLERAVSLLPRDDEERAALLPDLAVALRETGELSKAESVIADALDVAERCTYETVGAYARLERTNLRSFSDPEGVFIEGLREFERAIGIFEREGDERGLAEAWHVAAQSHFALGRMAAAEQALWQAAEHAEAAGDAAKGAQALSWVGFAARFGPTPAPQAIELCDLVLHKVKDDQKIKAHVLDARCALEAMLGQFSRARESAREAREIYGDLGLNVMGANLVQNSGLVEMLAGDPESAEREFRRGYVALDQMNERGFLSTVAAQLAHALYAQARYEEADRFTHISEDAAASDDKMSHILWRAARAKITAQRGLTERAETWATEAVALAEQTEFLSEKADALVDFAEVLILADRLSEAAPAIQRGLALYEQKGNIVSVAKARRLLKRLSRSSATLLE